MMDKDFYRINYSNSSFKCQYSDLFLGNNTYNKSIFDRYCSLIKQKSDLGVNVLKNANIFGEWGLILNNQHELPRIRNYGWFPDAYEHLSKNNSSHFSYNKESNRLIVNENCNFIEKNSTCAMLSFPGALTYGHWIVDIIIRYEFLNTLNLNHKIDKYIIPKSIGKWSDIFKEYLNLNEQILPIDNGSFYSVKELYVPTVASFLPGTTLPLSISGETFRKFKSFLISKKSNVIPLNNDIVMLKHTRQTSSSDRDIDLYEVEKYVESINGIVIDPLEYSLSDLIHLLKNCKLVIGQDSSALHNNAFIGADLIVIESLPRNNLLHLSIQHSIGKKLFYTSSIRNDEGYIVDTKEIKEILNNLGYY